MSYGAVLFPCPNSIVAFLFVFSYRRDVSLISLRHFYNGDKSPNPAARIFFFHRLSRSLYYYCVIKIVTRRAPRNVNVKVHYIIIINTGYRPRSEIVYKAYYCLITNNNSKSVSLVAFVYNNNIKTNTYFTSLPKHVACSRPPPRKHCKPFISCNYLHDTRRTTCCLMFSHCFLWPTLLSHAKRRAQQCVCVAVLPPSNRPKIVITFSGQLTDDSFRYRISSL